MRGSASTFLRPFCKTVKIFLEVHLTMSMTIIVCIPSHPVLKRFLVSKQDRES